MTNSINEANDLPTHKDRRMIREYPQPPASCIVPRLAKTASTVSTSIDLTVNLLSCNGKYNKYDVSYTRFFKFY